MKNKKSTAHGLSAEKLARLWNVGTDASEKDNNADPIQRRSGLLRDWLASTLPLDPELDRFLPNVFRQIFREVKPFTGETFGSLLKDSDTNISIIKKIKDFSRKMVESAKSEAEHDAAAVIYYAAIANALIFHNQRITSFSHTKLRDSFAEILGNTWLTLDLVKLYTEAHKLCKEKAKHIKQNN